MSIDQNKSLIRHYLEQVWDRENLAVIDELIAPDYIQHTQGVPPGREGVKQFFAMVRAAFPDITQTAEDMIAEGDKVVWRWTIRGTHTGPFQRLPPTGRQVMITGINIVRIADGRLAENWGEVDMLGLLQQLGAIPVPGQAG
jgi:steroid delta-isomerase-like uncharacterized protein